ncbi:aromatic prenyltransferase [Aspergillus pseudonomiae]|nr:aromatic prenyltransferase [Aspergillus pseudonomiae]
MDLNNSLGDAKNAGLSTPFEVLSRIFDFPDKVQLSWWYTIGPTFAKMMVDSDYSVHHQYEYLCFIYRYLLPVLKSLHAPTGKTALENTLVSSTPYEHSMNYQASKSTTRLYLEPTSHLDGTIRDPCNRLAVQAFLNRIQTALPNSGIDTTLFYFFADKLVLPRVDEARIRKTDIVDKLPNQMQCSTAFELKDGRIGMKTFMYPMMKALTTGKSVTRVLFDALQTLPALEGGAAYMPAISAIEEYVYPLTDKCPSPTMSTFFVGFDMVALELARIKVYISEAEVSWAKLADLWTLGGQLIDPDIAAGLELLHQVWLLLKIPEGIRRLSDAPPDLNDTGTLNQLLMSYEAKRGCPEPTPKAYISLRGFDENIKCERMISIFNHFGWTKHAASYRDNIQSYFPSFDFQKTTTIQSWLSFSYSKKTGPYMTMYFNELDTSHTFHALG